MNQFFASLPKVVLAIGAICLGFVLIILYDPPKGLCDLQMEAFREAEKSVLYTPTVANGLGNEPPIHELHEFCKAQNTPGACFDYLMKLRKFAADLNNIPRQCSDSASRETEINRWLWGGLKLMAEIAWGGGETTFMGTRNSWLDVSDISLFCQLKREAIKIYGDEKFTLWRESTLSALPKASNLSREVAWQRSIFSNSCEAFR